MTTFTEDFNRTDVTGLAGADLSLGQNTWHLTKNGSGVFSNTFASSQFFYAGASLSTGASSDHVVTVTTAAVSAGTSLNEEGFFGIDLCMNDSEFSVSGWEVDIHGTFNDGLWRYAVLVALTDGRVFNLNTLATSFMTGSIVQVGDTLTFQVVGQGTATVATLKQNGATVASFGQTELLAAGMVSGDFSLLPNGAWTQVVVGGNTANDNRIDNYTETVTAWPVGPVNHRLPALSSDVPYIQGNDRYQTLLCVNRGSTTTPPEFRYWYAGPPSWDESV